jgi:hypothetical protein
MRGRISYPNVMATVAVFIALGGGAYAVSLPDGSVTSEKIAKNAVRAKQIAKRAVRKKEVARNAIRSRKIKDARVKSFDLADAAVTSVKLGDEAVVTSKLAEGAVTTPTLGDDQVTAPKLGTVDHGLTEAAGSTSSAAAGDISPPGPELDVTLGANAFATVLAQATMTAAGGGTPDDCRFGVSVSGQGFEVQLPFEGGATFAASPAPRTEYAFTVPPLPGGDLSFRMVYRRASGDDPCTFSNRRLWVEVAEP